MIYKIQIHVAGNVNIFNLYIKIINLSLTLTKNYVIINKLAIKGYIMKNKTIVSLNINTSVYNALKKQAKQLSVSASFLAEAAFCTALNLSFTEIMANWEMGHQQIHAIQNKQPDTDSYELAKQVEIAGGKDAYEQQQFDEEKQRMDESMEDATEQEQKTYELALKAGKDISL
jgi:hypothetical protein